ncbi:MAG: lysophospholipid acyltransferase family protein [Alteraurantiacibacter sp.]
MSVPRSLLFYVAFYGGSVFWVLAAVAAAYVAPTRMRWFCDRWSGWHSWCVRCILGIEIRITGTRPAMQAFYALKHESFFEAIAMPWLFDFPATFAKQELSDIPAFGHASRVYGNISVARDQGASALRQMLREVRPVLAAGRPIAIFPEGTRVAHGTRPELQAGFAALYKLLGLPVVPVAVNSGPLYHRRWKRRGTITIHFGEPIPPGLPREEAEARVRDGINCLND